jgi:hypothetical protein
VHWDIIGPKLSTTTNEYIPIADRNKLMHTGVRSKTWSHKQAKHYSPGRSLLISIATGGNRHRKHVLSSNYSVTDSQFISSEKPTT